MRRDFQWCIEGVNGFIHADRLDAMKRLEDGEILQKAITEKRLSLVIDIQEGCDWVYVDSTGNLPKKFPKINRNIPEDFHIELMNVLENNKEKVKNMEKLTIEQAVVISAYTGILLCPFGEMHKAIAKKFGRPVFTHEFAQEDFVEEIKMKFRDDFLALEPVAVKL